MILFRFIDSNGKIVEDNTKNSLYLDNADKFWKKIKNNDRVTKDEDVDIDASGIRLIDNNKNILYFYVIADKAITKRNTLVRQQASFYLNYVNSITKAKENVEEDFTEKIQTILHNISDPQTRLQDEIESIIPEQELAICGNHEGQIKTAIKLIDKSTQKELATSLVELTKAVIDLRTQLTGIGILVSGDSTKLNNKKHNVRHVMERIIHPFYNEFSNHGFSIKYNIDYSEAENTRMEFDFEIFQMGMSHFFNNMVKYVCPESKVYIDFIPDSRLISFTMKSVCFLGEENDIYKMNYSGINSGDLAGSGIGLYTFKTAMDLLNIQIDTIAGEMLPGTKYANNEFNIIFNK